MEYYWNKLGENRELDLTKWLHRFTNDMIFRVSTGVKNDSIPSYYHILENNYNVLNEDEKEKIEESERFIQSVGIFLKGVLFFATLNKLIRNYIPFIRSKTNSLLKNRDYLFNKVMNIIKQRRIEIDNTPLDQPLSHDMLTSFITANTSRDVNIAKHADVELLRPMTDKEILGNLLDAMVAGTDTHYPKVKQRFLQELDAVLGKDLTKRVTSKDIDELHYCDAVIKEVYRYSPVVFAMGRVNIESDNIGGYDWPKGTSFHMLFSAMMKRKDYWTDPEKFDPDRFYKIEDDKYLLENQHVKNSFMMWGGGIRICPGRKLAMIELKCLLASIYRKYDIELVDMNAPLKYKSLIINVSEELLVKIKPRKL